MNYKTKTISLTLTLTVSYIGLVILYGMALAEGLNPQIESFNKKSEYTISESEIDPTNQYTTVQLQKENWELKLEHAELMLNIINEQQASN